MPHPLHYLRHAILCTACVTVASRTTYYASVEPTVEVSAETKGHDDVDWSTCSDWPCGGLDVDAAATPGGNVSLRTQPDQHMPHLHARVTLESGRNLTIRFSQFSLPRTAAGECADYVCLGKFNCDGSEQICGGALPFAGEAVVFGHSLQLSWHTPSAAVAQWQAVVGTTPPCGDGVRSSDEDCDMGILNGRMGCSDECRVLSGWHCDAGGCASVCGDGIRVEGEACDL
ncbi:hypothetical protein FOZ60_001353, partial [Perkinsus olseni]